MAFGIILVFDEVTNERFCAYADSIAEHVDPRNVVGRTQRLPHVSLAHFECEDGAEKLAWSRAVESVAVEVPLHPFSLEIIEKVRGDFYVPEGGVFFGIGLKHSPGLLDAFASVSDAVRQSGCRFVPGPPDVFAPHVTLGVLDRLPAISLPLPIAITRAPLMGRLALGRLEDYGSFSELLERV